MRVTSSPRRVRLRIDQQTPCAVRDSRSRGRSLSWQYELSSAIARRHRIRSSARPLHHQIPALARSADRNAARMRAKWRSTLFDSLNRPSTACFALRDATTARVQSHNFSTATREISFFDPDQRINLGRLTHGCGRCGLALAAETGRCVSSGV